MIRTPNDRIHHQLPRIDHEHLDFSPWFPSPQVLPDRRHPFRRVARGQLTALRGDDDRPAEDFHAALWTDLRRNRTDADLTDVKFLAAEADHALSHLRSG